MGYIDQNCILDMVIKISEALGFFG